MTTDTSGSLATAKPYDNQVADGTCVKEGPSSTEHAGDCEKLSPDSYEQSMKIKLRQFYELETRLLMIIGFAGAIVTFFKQNSNAEPLALVIYKCFSAFFVMIFIPRPVLELCHWKLERNIILNSMRLPIGGISEEENRPIVQHILRDPVLGAVYTAIIALTFWLQFICPFEFNLANLVVGFIVVMFLLGQFKKRFIPKEWKFDFSDSFNEVNGTSLCNRKGSPEVVDNQPLDLESVEQLLETTLKQQKENAGDDSVEGIIENYKAITNQKIKKYQIFRFVYPSSMMVLKLLKLFYFNDTEITSTEIFACTFDELAIATSFYLFGRLVNKRKEIILIDYLQGHIRDVVNEEKWKVSKSSRSNLACAFYIVAVGSLYIVVSKLNERYHSIHSALWVLFMVVFTNIVTTGKAFSFRNKAK